jgi:hypothetical protein
MKKLLTLALAVVALTAFTGLGIARHKVEVQKPVAGTVIEQRAPQQSVTGEVIRVDPRTKTFTARGKDFELTATTEGPLPGPHAKLCLCGSGDSDGGSLHLNWGNRCPCKNSTQ